MKIAPIIGALVIATACTSELENKSEEKKSIAPSVELEQISEEDVAGEDRSESIGENEAPDQEASKPNSAEWTFEVIPVSQDNWGYQLFQNGKMVINQTTIPSVQGNNGFDSAKKAERTAKYILTKLENGIFPPTVDRKELEELEVLRD